MHYVFSIITLSSFAFCCYSRRFIAHRMRHSSTCLAIADRRAPLFIMSASRVVLLAASLASGICSVGQAFVAPQALQQGGAFSPRTASHPRRTVPAQTRQGRVAHRMSTSTELKELGLTPELERLTKVFRSCPNSKMRQMQLLHLAQMGEALDPAFMTEENKVLG